MNTRNIKLLVDMMEKSSLTAMEIEEEGCKIRLERTVQSNVVTMTAPMMQPMAAQPVSQLEPVAQPKVEPAADAQPAPETKQGKPVRAPMVGVFYASSSPEAEPFVKVGTKVKKGDVLCIIEAMKLMNEVAAETDGEIAEICVQNGQIVEFGQPLFQLA